MEDKLHISTKKVLGDTEEKLNEVVLVDFDYNYAFKREALAFEGE